MTEKLGTWNDAAAEADTLAKRKAAAQAIAKGSSDSDFFGDLIGIPVGIGAAVFTGDPAIGLAAYKGTKAVVSGVDKALMQPELGAGVSDLAQGVTDFAKMDKTIQDAAVLERRRKTLEALNAQNLLDAGGGAQPEAK